MKRKSNSRAILLITLVIVLLLAACGNEEKMAESPAVGTEEPPEILEITEPTETETEEDNEDIENIQDLNQLIERYSLGSAPKREVVAGYEKSEFTEMADAELSVLMPNVPVSDFCIMSLIWIDSENGKVLAPSSWPQALTDYCPVIGETLLDVGELLPGQAVEVRLGIEMYFKSQWGFSCKDPNGQTHVFELYATRDDNDRIIIEIGEITDEVADPSQIAVEETELCWAYTGSAPDVDIVDHYADDWGSPVSFTVYVESGMVKDFCIVSFDWMEESVEGIMFEVDNILLNMGDLSAGQGVVMEVCLGEMLPGTGFAYTDQDGTAYVYTFGESGEDGSIYVTNDMVKQEY